MLTMLLFYIHSGLLLLFGVSLSVSFAGVPLSRKNYTLSFGLCVLSGAFQLVAYSLLGEEVVWNIYPLLAHLPLFLLLWLVFRRQWFSSICSICTAYLCCQPAKWLGILATAFGCHEAITYLVQIIALLIVAFMTHQLASPVLNQIFEKNIRAALIFGITPCVYYSFDYLYKTNSDFWLEYEQIALEFIAFLLCIVFLVFCMVYYKEYERKADAERKEQIIRITVEEQAKEIKSMEQRSLEIKILRHDLRLLLNNLSMCIDNNDPDEAQKLISNYIDRVEATAVVRYCTNTTINYVLSSFQAQCKAQDVSFHCQIELESIPCDEIMLSTLLSNALDNAIYAQELLPTEKRYISLMMKNHRGKFLLSIKNPFAKTPVFQDGIPVSSRKGHGLGCRSIVYLTEKMGGNYQFMVQNQSFILQVMI